MFRLHDSTRRQICVALFIGFCVLPTLGVGGWAISRRLPWNCHAEEARLSAELGLAVSLDSVSHTLPGVVRYTGLKLTDPETGRELLRCAEVEATWTSLQASPRPAIELDAREVESAASAWPRLKETLRRTLECQVGGPDVEIRITADRWTLHDGKDIQVLENVEVPIGRNRAPDPQGVQAQLVFRLATSTAKPLVRMRLLRDRTVEPPVYRFDIDSRAGDPPQCMATLIQAMRPAEDRIARAPAPQDGAQR
jgi:hypothetical protein